MGNMNQTPMSSRLMIGMFGRRNAGKSSLINGLTGQKTALVSDVAGTTTDPVYKSMELLPLGPVVFVDTAGFDDEGKLGRMRVKKTEEILHKVHLAILVISAGEGVTDKELKFAEEVKAQKVPCICVLNKCDERKPLKEELDEIGKQLHMPVVATSIGHVLREEGNGKNTAHTGIEELKAAIIRHAKQEDDPNLLEGLIEPGQTALLVVPIDKAAPKGRLILPQQQTIRELLDLQCPAIIVKETELSSALENLKTPPALVITDSQAFQQVSEMVPAEIPLTSFSLLFARQKGNLSRLIKGVEALKTLKDGDRILIMEACTHHRQDDDIGTVKIPNMLKMKTGADLKFEWSAGPVFKEEVGQYKVIIHCGGCMINRREMMYRIMSAEQKNVPITNYGMVIAWVTGILDRAMKPFEN